MPKPIRILHVGKFYAPVEGGIENVVHELVTSLRHHPEIESSVLVAQRKGPASTDQIEGITVHRTCSHGLLLGTPLAPTFPLEISALARNFDILHVHVPNPLPFFCDWSRLKRAGLRLIIHHHSDIIRPKQKAALALLRPLENRFYRAADKVITTSQGLLRNSSTLARFPGKSVVLPLSIDLTQTLAPDPTLRAQVREQLGLTPTETVFFFLGRLVYYKGVEDLLRAAVHAPGKLLIGGDGPLHTHLFDLCRALNLCHRVQFLGRIPAAELPGIFAAADAFVLPSNAPSEAFAVVQLEAMAHGLPVINTSLPTGVPDVSLHMVSGLTVSPSNPTALARAMRILATDLPLRQRLAAGALTRVQLFARPRITQALLELYREVHALPHAQPVPARTFQPTAGEPTHA